MSYDIELLQKQTQYNIFSLEKMKTIPTKTLLKVYKSLHSYTLHNGYYGEVCEVDDNLWAYKAALKSELNTREHIPKKKTSKPNPNRDLVLLKKKIRDYKYYLLSEEEIKKMYKRRDDLFFSRSYKKYFGLTTVLSLVKAIKHSKTNQELAK